MPSASGLIKQRWKTIGFPLEEMPSDVWPFDHDLPVEEIAARQIKLLLAGVTGEPTDNPDGSRRGPGTPVRRHRTRRELGRGGRRAFHRPVEVHGRRPLAPGGRQRFHPGGPWSCLAPRPRPENRLERVGTHLHQQEESAQVGGEPEADAEGFTEGDQHVPQGVRSELRKLFVPTPQPPGTGMVI